MQQTYLTTAMQFEEFYQIENSVFTELHLSLYCTILEEDNEMSHKLQFGAVSKGKTVFKISNMTGCNPKLRL